MVLQIGLTASLQPRGAEARACSPRREHRPRCTPPDRPTGSGLSRRPRRRTMQGRPASNPPGRHSVLRHRPRCLPRPRGKTRVHPAQGWRVSQGQSPWAGGIFNGGRNSPLEQDERGRRSNGCAVLHAHILRTVLTVMLLSLRWVPSRDFVEENIAEQHGSFHKKSPPLVNKRLRKDARRGGGFFVILMWSIRPPEPRRTAPKSEAVEGSAGDQNVLPGKRRSRAVASDAEIKLNK